MAAAHQRSLSDPPPEIRLRDMDLDVDLERGERGREGLGGGQSRDFAQASADQTSRTTAGTTQHSTDPCNPPPPIADPTSPDSPTHTRARRQSTWEKGHRRKHSPNLEWHERWTKDSWKQGRVLLIDYVAKELTGQGRRKIVAQEFSDIDGLRRFYRNEQLSQQAALRVIHVQNASWATRFLLRKFNIDASDDLVGTNFGRWARYEKPQRRGGKPVLNGKTFRAQRDPWRGISRTAFGCDYLRHYEKHKIDDAATGGMKMMELNHYDALDQPTYGWDVFVQRMSVYIQISDGEPGIVDPEIRNPYDQAEVEEYQRLRKQYGTVDKDGHEQYIPKLQTLDNGSTIILFEHSQSGSVQDTLVGARQELEQRWRRLTFYLPREQTDNDEKLATDCMDFILRDIFKALAFNWEKYINICETHVGILEDKIYEHPADESRAPELWVNSSLWLKVERLMYLHSDIVKEMKTYLRDAYGGDPADDQHWLGSTADEIDKLIVQFQEGTIKPTANLSDLMYKSVGIRDARHSLQLGLSMWRLSWITFIFLPLTFVCGFFGMNVDTFEHNPSIKWWFIATVPLFLLVFSSWYLVKHSLASQRQTPLRRGVYEALYNDLAAAHPSLWTRRGPRQGVVPVGWWAALRWRLVVGWFDSEKTVLGKGYDAAGDELGIVSRLKQYLARTWLDDLPVMPMAAAAGSADDLEIALANKAGFETVAHGLGIATPVALAEADPTAASRLRKRVPLGRWRSSSPRRSGEGSPRLGSGGREGSEGRPGSGVMVEEKSEGEGSEVEQSGKVAVGGEAAAGKKGKVASDEEKSGEGSGARGRERKTSFQERLSVPRSPGSVGGG